MQFNPAKTGDGRIIENGSFIWISFEPEPTNLIIKGKLDAIRSAYKCDLCVFVYTAQRLSGRNANCLNVG